MDLIGLKAKRKINAKDKFGVFMLFGLKNP